MRWVPMGVCLLLFAAACGDSSADTDTIRPLGDPTATTTSAPPPPPTTAPATTTTEPDPWAVPENPDAAYFERVLDELMVLDIELLRAVRDEGAFTDEHLERLRAYSTGINLSYAAPPLRQLGQEWNPAIILEGFARNTETVLVEFAGDCAVVETLRSFPGVHSPEREPIRLVIELSKSTPGDLNPTGWQLSQSWDLERGDGVTCAL